MDVKDAIRVAMGRVRELFEEDGVRGLRLEEVDTDADGNWLITVSFLPPLVPGNHDSLSSDRLSRTVVGVDLQRSYKEVQVGQDGTVKAIRLRPIVVR
jgi:hypothetical protein